MEQTDTLGARIPTATYRLQFNSSFGFQDAARIIPYLHALGISDVYASPCLKARSGSMHGYDIVDHNRLNPELGSRDDFDAYSKELQRHGMGQILDFVPNHMCVEGGENGRWLDLLENGPSSIHGDFFDVDWSPVKKELADKVLIPVLGDQYGSILENSELILSFEEGAFFISYYEHRFPIIPKTYNSILTHRLQELEGLLPADHEAYRELLSIVTAITHLPFYTERNPERVQERYREKEVIKRRLMVLYRDNWPIKEFIDENVRIFNGEKGNPRSFDLLDGLLRQQVYRLAHWRTATDEINYRRFFDINALGAIRMENLRVFEETHRLVLELVREGTVTGLRIDHADGLYDPTDYFRRLQRACFHETRMASISSTAEPCADSFAETILQMYDEMLEVSPQAKPFYIVGEKILMKNERLPEDWPVHGTTGYEFANAVTGLMVDTRNGKEFDAVYARFIQERPNFAEIAYQKKKQVMRFSMGGEINTLGHYLNTLSESNRHTRDFTLGSLNRALVEVIAHFPVYRTYTATRKVADRDRQYIEYAVAKAKRRNPAMSESIFTFIEDVLLLRFHDSTGREEQEQWIDFVMKFQQLTGPVMAKGLEDTAFYVYNRLVCLNEVGGTPERFGMTLEAFHGQNIERARSTPLAMLATSTHDTKRSEDVRARISVLSEDPAAWHDCLIRWNRMNRGRKVSVQGVKVPDRNEEYLLYQTIAGAWPTEVSTAEGHAVFTGRIREYLLKAMREAKVNTSWINPDSVYEEAALHFVDAILRDVPANGFLADLRRTLPPLIRCGMLNSLSQTLLKVASPGIPDFYQGTELWDFSLVDPDNRRPVEFKTRTEMLAALQSVEREKGTLALARELLETMADGRVKLFLAWKSLTFRREHRALFEVGKYLPLEVLGERSDNVCAFERYSDGETVIAVAPRFFTRLGNSPLGTETWGDTRIAVPFEGAGCAYRNVLTGERVMTALREGQTTLPLAAVLGDFPVGLLEAVEPE
ncbi:malto-oligosyltrehalose synthase [Geobacter hydrogenophilus]|uniref:Maltooligosyl trehalose synthase n=1 Tax=Geobacter hydrogenophilus TaxID=40983 RepID=A0A9W6L9I0_9BACT|nr:malto-oligosyltrehalose synthase [Geobacter hydrogenophilus]MBT0895413.1 malto-oligosyltrehalose synthase [Geobacter hydrogenophilus]GLI36507.1 maltooligosyl trehalose synthase [Geobacter hydrogenophilus]